MKKKIIILIILSILLAGLFAYNIKINKKDNENTNIINNYNNNYTENILLEENNEENINNTTDNNIDNNVTDKLNQPDVTIIETMTPSGFMGSSLKKVILYSNGDVYLINYDGEGYDEKNISSKEIVAKNATALKYKGEEEFEAIVIKGSNLEIVNENIAWLQFERN